MTADLRAMDDSVSASTIDDAPRKGPICTYNLPSTPPSDLPVSTRLRFAKDSILHKLNLGQKSAEQLKEEELELKREGERRMRMEARQKSKWEHGMVSSYIGGGGASMGGGGGC